MVRKNIIASLLAGALTIGTSAGFVANAHEHDKGAAASTGDATQVKVPAGIYKLDPTHAALLWSLKHNNISNYTGRFTVINATLDLNPEQVDKSSITFTIDPKSVQTSYPSDYKASHADSPYQTWDEAVSRTPSFLNADKFPNITFKSTKVEQTGALTAKVTGDLTFLGVTKPVTLDATFLGGLESHPFMKVPAVGFSAKGHFNRSEFGLEPGPVGEVVTIRFDGEFVKDAGAAPAK